MSCCDEIIYYGEARAKGFYYSKFGGKVTATATATATSTKSQKDANIIAKKLAESLAYEYAQNNANIIDQAILNSNGLNDSNLQQFIKQDASEIFKALPGFFDKFAQGVTDLAGKASEVLGKGKRKKRKVTKKRKF